MSGSNLKRLPISTTVELRADHAPEVFRFPAKPAYTSSRNKALKSSSVNPSVKVANPEVAMWHLFIANLSVPFLSSFFHTETAPSS